jgi:hypothetical protein
VLARCVEAQAVATATSARGGSGGGGNGSAPAAPFVAVELGAGSGLVSVVAGAAGLSAIATEQASGLPYLRANAAANASLFSTAAGAETTTPMTQQQQQQQQQQPVFGSCTVQKMHWGTDADVAAVAAIAARLARKNIPPLPAAVAPRPSRRGTAPAPGVAAPALLLGSDLTYLPAVMEPLAATLASLAGPQTVAWIAHDDASHPVRFAE